MKSGFNDLAQSISSASIIHLSCSADLPNGPMVRAALASKTGPQALRMNLNTLLLHDVLATSAMVDCVADRSADEKKIRASVSVHESPADLLGGRSAMSRGIC